MKPLYLLDTNILSSFMRDQDGPVAARIAFVGDDKICTSLIVASELRFGVIRKQSSRLTKKIEALLKDLKVFGFESPADKYYASLRFQLERQGTPISANDMLIAAHCLSLGLILVTDNVKEFSRVKGLKIENWMR